MVTRIDLRVYTAAPSSRKDDERFKAQAEAYNNFVLATTHVISADAKADKQLAPPHPDALSTGMIPPEATPVPSQQADEQTHLVYDPTTFLEETQLGYTALESQLFAPPSRTPKVQKQPTHTIDHVEATQVEFCEREAERSNFSNPRSDATPSRKDASSSSHGVPSQSSYLKSPILDRSNKKPRINETNRHLFRSNKDLLPPFIPLQENDGVGVGFISKPAHVSNAASRDQDNPVNIDSNSMSGDDVTSELPTSYSLSEGTSGSSRSKQHSVQRSVSDPGPSPLEATALGTDANGEARQSPAMPPRRPSGSHNESVPQPEPARSNSSKASNSETAVRDFASVAVTLEDSTTDVPTVYIDPDLPTSVRPPPPQPSLQHFETHVTESLKYLSENANMAQCYKPIFVSRDLEQSERGCWVINISPWPAQLRVEFFQFLAKMIEPGRVGWGIWCVREPSSLEVRVFCWGEVVRHVYLMLYVASKSKVRKLGLRWIDAKDEIVVQMRGADEPGKLDRAN